MGGDIAVRLRTVSSAAPPSARRANTAPAPTAALDQSNPSPVVGGESETTGGWPFSAESPESCTGVSARDALALTEIASAETPRASARTTYRALRPGRELVVMVGALIRPRGSDTAV